MGVLGRPRLAARHFSIKASSPAPQAFPSAAAIEEALVASMATSGVNVMPPVSTWLPNYLYPLFPSRRSYPDLIASLPPPHRKPRAKPRHHRHGHTFRGRRRRRQRLQPTYPPRGGNLGTVRGVVHGPTRHVRSRRLEAEREPDPHPTRAARQYARGSDDCALLRILTPEQQAEPWKLDNICA
jgi:hypothetical protein